MATKGLVPLIDKADDDDDKDMNDNLGPSTIHQRKLVVFLIGVSSWESVSHRCQLVGKCFS